jgi:hypothetical protein
MKQGEFGPWVKLNFGLSQKHANRYMAFAHATSDGQIGRFGTFSDFMREEGGDPGYKSFYEQSDRQAWAPVC